ncbi:hypothetical protein MIND_00221900 [Mycena indigotica]|uniref:DUF2855 family protein n=1 Tax=Mycena indigotica TaxID=2126181 RepID=A0A8H6T703_9AGAR|nr:uncharacterized protein MIND_00221900 [Mycena indigotica]KAF7312096.1 hypothetical protein MIND_00221900 [Mycena indigotica]
MSGSSSNPILSLLLDFNSYDYRPECLVIAKTLQPATSSPVKYLLNLSFCVRRPSALDSTAEHAIVVSHPIQALPPNHVLLKVERFGFSANNITYEALGEHSHFRYFDFHAAPPEFKTTHGLVPVWGFATVVASSHNKISVGERVYGYLAPCQYLLVPVSASDVNRHAFYVPRPHLPPDRRPYNQITRCDSDPEYIPTEPAEDLTMLYRPLFWTAYWFEDWIHSVHYRGATNVLISSASAKTAFCTAYLIRKRRTCGQTDASLKIFGLTSQRNIAFTRGLGLYDEVLEYAELERGLGKGSDKWLYIDVAGNDKLNARLFKHFHDGELAGAVSLGMTSLAPASKKVAKIDWQTNTFSETNKEALQMENFFMVEWLSVRKHQLSLHEIFSRQKRAWKELMTDCVSWVKLVRVSGPDAVKRVYDEVAKSGIPADVGYVWSLWDEEQRTVLPGKL